MRLLLGGLGCVVVYLGYYWVSPSGFGCAPAEEDELATLGWILLPLGLIAIGCAYARRIKLGYVAIAIGAILFVVGTLTALSCLR